MKNEDVKDMTPKLIKDSGTDCMSVNIVVESLKR